MSKKIKITTFDELLDDEYGKDTKERKAFHKKAKKFIDKELCKDSKKSKKRIKSTELSK